MRHNKNNVVYHELIGLTIKVLSHSDPMLVGRRGLVVDETLNTIVIVDMKSRKLVRIPKHYGVFQFLLPTNEWVTVDGTLLYGRPEDRLKKIGK
ncbi:MAG: ribonuclease P protein subunit [Ignisphaera sp.]|uniref:Ribonuclease P protein component 1 n=1 Tax=Ignisphaera aggregans TaxID=334771 RepID=A0A7J3MZP7_9CREN